MDAIGIDPGCSVTGWAVFRDGTLYKYGLIRPKGVSVIHKIDYVLKKLHIIMEEFNISICSIEDSYVNLINPYSSLKLSMLRGSIIAFFLMRNIHVYMFTPTQIKYAIAQNGHATKEDIMQEVLRITGIQITSKDINDAIATCLCLLKQI